MNRRQFLAQAAAAGGAAAFLAACGDGIVSNPAGAVRVPIDPIGSTELTVTVSSIPELATVGVLVQIPSSFVAAKRTSANPAAFDAFSMACTHEGFLVNITNGQRFDCPAHFSRFDNNGNVVIGPATRPLQKIPTTYDPATDTLTIG